MSPLARSLLALAFAALLQAAYADSEPPKCNTAVAGTTDGYKISLPKIKVLTSLGPEIDYLVKDNCNKQGLFLQGETATACDWNAKPGVGISTDFKIVHVSRYLFEHNEKDATLQVDQYCI